MTAEAPGNVDLTNTLAAQLLEHDTSGVEKLFATANGPAPVLIWSPDTRIAGNSLLDRFVAICNQLADGRTAIPRHAFSLHAFAGMQDWLMLLTADPDNAGYRYDHYGTGISNTYGKDMTGASTRDFPGHIGTFFTAVYRAVTERKLRLLTIHQPPNQVFVTNWRRMIIPLSTPVGDIDGFIVMNTPENQLRAGLEILPLSVLILDADMGVCYANKVARQTFDQGHFGPWNRSLFEYAGLDLLIGQTPGDILLQGVVQTTLCRHLMHQRIGAYEATVSAALHHDTAFYVVLLQPRLG